MSPHSSPENGVALIQWVCNGQPSQRFMLELLPNGFYKIHMTHVGGKSQDPPASQPSHNMCVSITRGLRDAGTRLEQWPCVVGAAHQRFRFA